jgi:hypothetical protein
MIVKTITKNGINQLSNAYGRPVRPETRVPNVTRVLPFEERSETLVVREATLFGRLRSTLLTTLTVAFQDHVTQHRVKSRRLSNSQPFLRSRVIHFALSLSKPSARKPQMSHR